MTTLPTGNQVAADVSFTASGAKALISGETYYIVLNNGGSFTILDSFVADSAIGDTYSITVSLPANTPIKLQVTNAGDAAVEFESFELHRERVVQPGQTITVYIPALPPGTYPFFDDFSHGAVKGEIVSR